LSWTFYARRVRANPPYYGAKSSNDIDVEDFLISVAKTALSKLKESGCIDYGDKDENPGVKPLILGQASSMYYLIFTTPKQMEFGARSCAKVVLQGLDQGEENERKRYAKGQSPLLRSARLDEMSAAWILYVLCSTHEFDEHPVRHNEEYLNEELSQKLKWGPDTTGVVSNGGAASYGPTVFQDPHTKCFLLLQAYLEHTSLPITDYVNDTKTVTENIPRLLAAFHFIARHQEAMARGFDVLTQVSRTHQLFCTRSMPDQDPLLQLPRVTNDTIKRLKTGTRPSAGAGVDSLYGLRSMSRSAAALMLSRLHKGGPESQKPSLDQTLDKLYSLPMVRVKSSSIQRSVTTAPSRPDRAVLLLDLEFDVVKAKNDNKGSNRGRDDDSSSASARSDSPSTLTLLLGTERQGYLLAYKTVSVRGSSSAPRSLELEFDWDLAMSDSAVEAGAERNVVLRLLWEEVRGLDSEIVIGVAA
jgi:Sec63 Brl domain